MLTINTTPHPLEDAAARLNTLLNEVHEKDVLLLLSGGSALALVAHIDTALLGTHVTVTVLDERWTYEAKDSNFAQLTAHPAWQRMLAAGVHTLDPRPREPEDLYDTAKRFDLALKHWHITHRDGVVIITMGVGADGHTAGILPAPEDPHTFATRFEHTTTCIRGYTVPPSINPHTRRMTATLTYLRRHVDHAVVYAVGADKASALKALAAADGTLHATPARILHNIKDAQLFIK